MGREWKGGGANRKRSCRKKKRCPKSQEDVGLGESTVLCLPEKPHAFVPAREKNCSTLEDRRDAGCHDQI